MQTHPEEEWPDYMPEKQVKLEFMDAYKKLYTAAFNVIEAWAQAGQRAPIVGTLLMDLALAVQACDKPME